MKNAFVLMLLSAASVLWGQRSTELGLFVGASNYQGDLAKSPVSFNETSPAIGIVYQHFLDRNWGVKAAINYGKISGRDSNLGPDIQRYRDWVFSANLLEIAGHMQYHPFGKARYDPRGQLVRSLSPYASAGLGMAFARSEVTALEGSRLKVDEPNGRSSFIVIPISAGLRYVMTERLTLTGEFGQRAVFSDFLDGVSNNGNPDAKDWYMFFGLGLTYTLVAEY